MLNQYYDKLIKEIRKDDTKENLFKNIITPFSPLH
jgi:hypothetical protein